MERRLEWSSVRQQPANYKRINMKVFVVLSVVAIALAAEGPAYSKPEYTTSAYTQKYDHAPMPYSFVWAVKDDPSYNDFTHQESSDGKVVSGSYKVLLPDGRVQIVTYKADDYGYVADVQYQGEAKYDYKPSSYQAPAAYPKPSYSSPAYTTPAYTTPSYTTPAYSTQSYSTPAYPAAYPKASYRKDAYPSHPTYGQTSYTTPSYTPALYKKAKY